MKKYTDPVTGKEGVWLGIDEYTIVSKSLSVKTVLGSCVALILYDKVQDFFAVNHYLNTSTGEPIIKKMASELGQKNCKHLTGIVIGGSNKESAHYKVGELNIALAKKFLQDNKIPLEREDVGGKVGRTINVFFHENQIRLDIKIHEDPELIKETKKAPSTEHGKAASAAFDVISKMINKKN